MLPLWAVIGGGAAVVSFFSNVEKFSKMDAETKKKNIKAYETIMLAQKKVDDANLSLELSLQKAVNRKSSIMKLYMLPFQDIYSVIREIQFEPGDGIAEIERYQYYSESVELTLNKVNQIKTGGLSDKEILANVALFGLTKAMVKDSEIKASAANSRLQESAVIEKQAETICLSLNGVQKQVDLISDLLAKLGMLFNKSLKSTTLIIEKNGKNKHNYSHEEKKVLATCINFAQTVYLILDTPILNKSGEISKASYEAISIGNDYLHRINRLSNLK